jgi:hypothetical protein
MVTDVALDAVTVRVEDPPEPIDVGLALMLTVGAVVEELTVIVRDV